MNIEEEKYSQDKVDQIYNSYRSTLSHLKARKSENKKQFNFYLESQVRKMFTGGFIPALFGLDEVRKFTIFDFPATGESWAYFYLWQQYQRRKINREKIWNFIIKFGSVAGIILSVLKFIEFLEIPSR